MNNWYTGSTSGGQGLVIEESTGRNVAVTYDASDAPLAAAAPALLTASQAFLNQLDNGNDFAAWEQAKAGLRAAVSQATESAR